MVVPPASLNEAERTSLARIYAKTVEDLQKDPKNFNDFQALKRSEINARNLAEEYLEKKRKNLVPFNSKLTTISERFADKSARDIIREANPTVLRNRIRVRMLVETVKDCVESAYILAMHRSTARNDDSLEEIKNGNALMQQQLNTLVANMNLNQRQIANRAPVPMQNAGIAVQQNPEPPLRNIPVVVPAGLPSWILPEQDCRIIYNSTHNVNKFSKQLILNLFTKCEIITPYKAIPAQKKAEYYAVIAYFYGNDLNWETLFKKSFINETTQARQKIFEKISMNIAYGIASNGFEFFYTCPASNQMQCYSDNDCNTLLETRLVGNILVPQTCGTFEYIILLERQQSKKSKIRKLRQDGRLIDLK
jgi:hypothetical protein